MKKVLSLIMVCAIVFSALSISVFATNSSMTGKITVVDGGVSDIVLSDSSKKVSADANKPLTITPYDVNGKVIGAGESNDKVLSMKKDFANADLNKLAPKTPNAKLYGFFTVELSSDVEILKASTNVFGVNAEFLSNSVVTSDVVLKSAKVTVDVPGVTKDNAPAIVRYNTADGTFTSVESTVSGSTLTFNAEAEADGVGYFAVVYTATTASPKTNVATYAFAVIFVIALAGATFAGKKAFAKR